MDHNDDDNIIQDYDGSDYVVIPRPEELINQQKQSSNSKITVNKSVSSTPKKSADCKHSSKSRERKTSNKHERKGSSKERNPFKLSSEELSKKAEANKKLRQRQLTSIETTIKGSSPKRKTESSKAPGDDVDSVNFKSKQSGQDADKLLGAEVPKILTEPSVTPLQRFRTLDSRDSALRAKIAKPEDSKKVKIIGTCPDMCPEKERYSRIAKNCLSVLEMPRTFDQYIASQDTDDHWYMIKEYSRSSADQQEPLPHELRPISVLKLTMDYLICNIMDKPPDSVTLEDWYDFIWNRTRSIRKDITQQELCDLQCVEIIEKCIRFHIHCAEALSEEDTVTFDPKINNENLTKCLQTLKHMYHDLQSKGIQCPNEAEFRSYDILLSLTEGETLRLIKDIRKDLLKSPEIKSAFEVALAFSSDNYVKFFNIVEKADYLSSCILHRYIIKVRSNALQIIVRAYSTQHNVSMYPIASLVRYLKFENEAEASEFCRCHGLDVNEEFISIDRKQFSKSASGLPLSRSSLLVGCKRSEHLGKIISKGELPSNPKYLYQPSDSFDENNMLRIGNIDAIPTDTGEEELLDEKIETSDILPICTDSLQSVVSNSEKKAEIEHLIKDPSIHELEKRRSKLLEKLSKMEAENAEKLKQKKEKLFKHVEKSRSSKKSHSPSKSHKSIMFSSENSSSSVPETVHKSEKRWTNITTENVCEFSDIQFPPAKLPTSTDLPFFKFGSLSSVKAFAPVGTSSSINQTYLPTTIPNMPVVSSVTSQDNVIGPSNVFNAFFPPVFSQEQQMALFTFGLTTAAKPTSKKFSDTFTSKSLVTAEHNLPVETYTFANVSEKSQKQTQKLGCELDNFNQKPGIPEFVLPDHAQEGNIFSQNSSPTNLLLTPIQESSLKANSSLPELSPFPVQVKDILNTESSFSCEKEDHLKLEEIISKKEDAIILQDITEKDFVYDSESNDIESAEIVDSAINDKESQEIEELNKFVDEVAYKIVGEFVEENSPSICEEVLNEERKIQEQLNDEIEIIRNELARKALLRWHLFAQRRREKRLYEHRKFYSPWTAMLLNTRHVPSGAVSPVVAYNKHCSLSKTTAEIIKKRKEIIPGWESINAEEIWTSDRKLQSYYTESAYFGKSGIKNFFKVCLVLPPAYDSNVTVFIDWMCAKFALNKDKNSEFDCKNVFMLHNGKTAMSVRAMQLSPDMTGKYAKFLDGVTAMMAFVPPKDHKSFLQSFTTLRDSGTLDFHFPLCMYFMESEEIPASIQLYIDEKVEDLSFTAVNTICMPEIHDFIENSKKLLEGLKWFNHKDRKPQQIPSLKKTSLRHYIEDAFTAVFNVLMHKTYFDEYKFLMQDPQRIINFHNKVMKYRASVLCDDFLQRVHLSWPPEEMEHLLGEKFINLETQNVCKNEMEKLLLPDFKGSPFDHSCAWKYARLVPSSSTNIVLSIKISDSRVNWIQKMSSCAEHLIQNSEFVLTNGDVPVYYIEEELLNFDPNHYWLDVLKEAVPSFNYLKRKTYFTFGLLKKKKVNSIPEIASKEHKTNVQSSFDTSSIFSSTPKQLKVSSTVDKSLEKKITQTAELDKENTLEMNPSYFAEPAMAVGFERNSAGLLFKSFVNSEVEKDLNWLGIDLQMKNPSTSAVSSIADKISELQYKIKKNCILEDHFTQLLKQL